MKETKKTTRAASKAEPVKDAVKAEAAKVENAVKSAAMKAAAEKAKPVVKAAKEKAAPVVKAAEKKAAAAKAAIGKGAVTEKISVQFGGKSYTTEDFVRIAKDVWKYDLGREESEFKSVELFVKPEESTVYYVINEDVLGNFAI